MTSYRATQVELISSPSPRTRHKSSRQSNDESSGDSPRPSHHRLSSPSLATSDFTTDRQRESFNAIISLHDLPSPTTPTREHQICGFVGFAVCIVIVVILSFGKLTHWTHRSYVVVEAMNGTKIYNSSFTVTCSWHKMYFESTIPTKHETVKYFGALCKDNVVDSCAMHWGGIIFFVSMLLSALLLLAASVLLVDPPWCRCLELKYAKVMVAVCGLLSFLSIIPMTLALNRNNKLCGYKSYDEWNEESYSGFVENQNYPLWTMYVSPIIGVFLTLSACFISQIAIKIEIEM